MTNEYSNIIYVDKHLHWGGGGVGGVDPDIASYNGTVYYYVTMQSFKISCTNYHDSDVLLHQVM